jgi:methyl acetate hydrolase
MSMQSTLDEILTRAVADQSIAGAVAMVGQRKGLLYEGAAGVRAAGLPAAMTTNSTAWLASLSKVVTTVAVMQCVERGLLDLDAPAANICPTLGTLQVRERFDEDGQPVLRAPKSPITLRQLLSHSSGLGYELFHPDVRRELEQSGKDNVLSGTRATLERALVADPGSAWVYSIGIDWAGLMLEAVTGKRLGDYLQAELFTPLGMTDTGFTLSAEQAARRASLHARTPDGGLQPIPFELPPEPEVQMGGHALFGSAPDYMKFMRMLLNDGTLEGAQILKPSTVAEMRRNQIGALDMTPIPTAMPDFSFPVNLHPDTPCKFGLGGLVNTDTTPQGRAAGSYAWVGLSNIYFWVDPTNDITGIVLTQSLPFFDPAVVKVVNSFERAVYDAASKP